MNAFATKLQEAINTIKKFYPESLVNPTITETEEKITILYEVGLSEAASVEIELLDIGDEDERLFDTQISVGNGDAVGPIYMQAALQLCLESFYEQGLNKRWGKLIGETLTD